MNKNDSVFYGAKRNGRTYVYEFEPSDFDEIKAGAKRFGLSLAEFLCRLHHNTTHAPELPEPRKFTHADRKNSTLKLQINPECDDFTRRCLERQAALWGGSVEEYLLNNVFMTLENDEDNALIDPETGEGALRAQWDYGNLIGYFIDKGAPPVEHEHPLYGSSSNLKLIPAGTIVEQCA